MATLQKKVQVNVRYRVEKVISKTAPDAAAGDNRRFFNGGRRGGGFLAVLNQEENVAVFGDASSHSSTETHGTTRS